MRLSKGITVDAEFQELERRGYTGNLNDKQFAQLGDLGFTGALPDRFGRSQAAFYDSYFVSGKKPELALDFSTGGFWHNSVLGSFGDAVTHSASSNATMVDSDGLLKWRPHNLLTYSDDITAGGWTELEASFTSGSFGGQLIVENTALATSHAAQQLVSFVSGAEYTLTVKAKREAGTRNLRLNAATTATFALDVYFDLSDGTVVAETLGSGSVSGPDADGFYTLTVTGTAGASASTNLRLSLTEGGDPTYDGDGVSSVEIKEPHLYRSDLGGMVNNPDRNDSYVPTTSAAVYLPRRGHHVWSGSAWVNEGLLHESEARTNTILQSNDFTTTWGAGSGGVTITASQETGPDGEQSLTKLARIDGNADSVTQTVTLAADTTYTVSSFWKAGTANRSGLTVYDNNAAATLANFEFNWSSGVPSTQTSIGVSNISYEDWGDGLYRVSFSFTTAATVTTHILFIYPEKNGSGTEDAYAGFVQLEAGSTPSSYIPTAGSTVTRAAETLTVPAANLPWPEPVVIGDELVTNGAFDTDSDWTKGSGWTISGGAANYTADPAAGRLNQTIGISSGKVYEVTYTLSNMQAGSFLGVRLGGTTNLVSYSGVQDGTYTSYLVAEGVDTILKFATGVGGNVSIDNISVREINPLAVSIQMEGRVTYADEDLDTQIRFSRWFASSSNYIAQYLQTNGARTGLIRLAQNESGVFDSVGTSDNYLSPSILVPFNIASRHGSTFINGAVDGTALTANTTPVALPDLSSTDLELGETFMGTIKTFRVWATDLGDTGIEEAST